MNEKELTTQESLKLILEKITNIEERLDSLESQVSENSQLFVTVVNRLDSIDERTISIEERLVNMESRFDVIEQNISGTHRNIENIWRKMRMPESQRYSEVKRQSVSPM